jgi:hypothetical protein
MKYVIKISLIMLAVIFLACNEDDSSSEEPARLSVKLVDAPGDYDAVFVDVQDVVVKYNGNLDDEDDVVIGDVNSGIYNLLELTGGASVLLVDDDIPAGNISQIRLILGTNNSVVVDGETFPLSTPSAQQSGLKIQVNETLEGGIFYEFILDFDADKSIVNQGNGDYSLKPVIRASTVAASGAISGTVNPSDFQTEVIAVSGELEITTYTDATGNFVLSGVPNGVYIVSINPDAESGFESQTFVDVEVVNGEVTSIGNVEL